MRNRSFLGLILNLLFSWPAFGMGDVLFVPEGNSPSSVVRPMKYIVLEEDVPFSEQVVYDYTVYEVCHDFDLNGSSVTIPEGSLLFFNGGSLSNGSVIGNGTRINTEVEYRVFDNVVFSGFDLPFIDIRWVGGVSDCDEKSLTGTDNGPAFAKAIDLAGKFYPGLAIRVVGKYLISSSISTDYDINIFGFHNNSRRLLVSDPIPSSPSLICVAEGVTAFTMNGQGRESRSANFSFHNLKISGASSSCFLESTASGAPSRVSVIEECEFRGLGYCVKLSNSGRDTMLGNLTVEKCNVWYCGKFIAAYSSGNNRTFTNLIVENCNIEQGGSEQLHLENVFGPIIIKNNIIEGLSSPLYFSSLSAKIRIEDNYFEALSGDAITIVSRNMNTDVYLGGNFYDSSIRYNLSLCQVYNLDFRRCSSASVFRMCTIDKSCVNLSDFDLSWISLYCLFDPDQMTGMIPSTTYPLIDRTIGPFLARSCDTSYGEFLVHDYDSTPSKADCFAFVVDGTTLSIGLGVNGSAVYNTIYTREKTCIIYRQLPYSKGRNKLYIKGNSQCVIGVPQFIPIETGNIADIRLATINNTIACSSVNRPTFEKPIGFSVFDVDLKRTLFWDGASWVDGMGEPVK